jgi:iron complex outermembrane receptor protein
MRAHTHGIELTADYRPVDAVRLQASYSWLEIQIREKAGNADPNSLAEERKSPRHQAGLASYINLTDQVELDLQFRYVGALPALAVKEYLTCDARIAWLATPGLELSLVGKNLFSAKHREFGIQDVASSTTYRVPREAYIIMNWYF